MTIADSAGYTKKNLCVECVCEESGALSLQVQYLHVAHSFHAVGSASEHVLDLADVADNVQKENERHEHQWREKCHDKAKVEIHVTLLISLTKRSQRADKADPKAAADYRERTAERGPAE